MPPLDEQLPQSAQKAFELAAQLCGDCVPYHAIWPTLRLAGIFRGLDRDRPGILEVLTPLVPTTDRILIAGSADSGVLALVAEAVAGHPVDITVVDRCATPLALCEDLAVRYGLSVRTEKCSLEELPRSSPADLAIGHSVFAHIPPDRHAAALSGLYHSLNSGGHLLLVFRDRVKSDGGDDLDGRSFDGWTDWLMDRTDKGLAAVGLSLPFDRAAFRAQLHAYAQTRAERQCGYVSAESFDQSVRAAGFVVERLEPLPPGMAWREDGAVESNARPSHLLLARRPGTE